MTSMPWDGNALTNHAFLKLQQLIDPQPLIKAHYEAGGKDGPPPPPTTTGATSGASAMEVEQAPDASSPPTGREKEDRSTMMSARSTTMSARGQVGWIDSSKNAANIIPGMSDEDFIELKNRLNESNVPYVLTTTNSLNGHSNVPVIALGQNSLLYQLSNDKSTTRYSTSGPTFVRRPTDTSAAPTDGQILSLVADIDRLLAGSGITTNMYRELELPGGNIDSVKFYIFNADPHIILANVIYPAETELVQSASASSCTPCGATRQGTYTVGNDLKNVAVVKNQCNMYKTQLDYIRDNQRGPETGYSCTAAGAESECNPEYIQEQLALKKTMEQDIAGLRCQLRWKQIVLNELILGIKNCEKISKKNMEKCEALKCGPEVIEAKACPANTENRTCKRTVTKKRKVTKKSKTKTKRKKTAKPSGFQEPHYAYDRNAYWGY